VQVPTRPQADAVALEEGGHDEPGRVVGDGGTGNKSGVQEDPFLSSSTGCRRTGKLLPNRESAAAARQSFASYWIIHERVVS
jgi:hypothetical protein